MQGVEIIPLELIKQDERGSMFQFANRETPRITLVKRNQGTTSASCYHTGKDPSKFPKMVVIMDGEVEFIFKNVKTKEEHKETITRPTMIKIAPYIYHEVLALTDIVVVDMNSADWYEDDKVKGMTE